MEELEKHQTIKNFESDHDRLKFIVRRIRESIRSAPSQKRFDQAVTKTLSELREELSRDERLKENLAEISAIIDAIRIMFVQQWIIKYKEHEFIEGAPALAQETIKEQDNMREDLTEARAMLQWHILQNEQDPVYLQEFIASLDELFDTQGFADEKDSLMRGIVQELGVYKLLKRHFSKVTPATPKEDANFSIDFWAEKKDGRKIMIQSKSSSAFGRDGVFNEAQIKKLKEEIRQRPDGKPDLYENFRLRGNVSPLVRVKSMEKGIETAKKYAEKRGIKNPALYFIIARSNNFEYPTGQPIPLLLVDDLEQQIKTLAEG